MYKSTENVFIRDIYKICLFLYVSFGISKKLEIKKNKNIPKYKQKDYFP